MPLFAPHIITPDSALGGIQIERSVRLWSQEGAQPNSGAVYFSRTGFGNSTTRTKATLSFWMKLTEDDYGHSLFVTGYSGSGGSQSGLIMTRNTSGYFVSENQNNAPLWRITSTTQLNDATAWYHFVISYDSTQASASDRTKNYINGVLETSYATCNYVPQNQDFYFTKNGLGITIGDNYQGGSHQNFFDGLLSHFVCVDGLALDATSFGETDSDTGEWKWKGISGVTYGNNGFYLLKDVANVTDYSGNNNNFTASGGGMTLTQDNPSNNFPTMKSPGWSDHAHSYGGNRVVTSGTNYRYSVATMGVN